MRKERLFYGWVVVAVLMGMFALSSGSRYTFGVVFKTLTEEFGWERGALSAVASLSLILVSAFQILGGWLSDRFGARLVLTVGFALSAIVLMAMSMVTELWQMYLVYGVLGALGFALVSPVSSTALVNHWFHSRARGTALSLTTAGTAVGQLAITPLAAYLLVNGGWESAYRAEALFMGLIIFPLVVLLLRNAPPESRDLSVGADGADARRTSVGEAIRHATWWQLLMGVFSCGFTMSFASVHFVAYATDMGMDHETAAGALGISGLFSIIGAVLMGKWSDRIGRHIPLGVTYALRGLSFVILLFASNDATLFLFGIILGLSWTSTTSLSAAITVETWGRQSSGFLFAFIFTFMTVGSSVGSYLGGLNYDLVHNYTAIIIANSVIAALGALASFSIREPRVSEPPSLRAPALSASAGR
jgi:MFS family permease